MKDDSTRSSEYGKDSDQWARYWKSVYVELEQKHESVLSDLAECRQQLSEARYTISQLQQGKEG